MEPVGLPAHSLLPTLPVPPETAQWWLVEPSPMAFENIGFTRPVQSVSQGPLGAHWFICLVFNDIFRRYWQNAETSCVCWVRSGTFRVVRRRRYRILAGVFASSVSEWAIWRINPETSSERALLNLAIKTSYSHILQNKRLFIPNTLCEPTCCDELGNYLTSKYNLHSPASSIWISGE